MEREDVCPLCRNKLLLVDYELVCKSCGYVIQNDPGPSQTVLKKYSLKTDLLTQSELGSYIGTVDFNSKGICSLNIREGGSSIRYLKVISDYGLKSQRSNEENYCMRILSRICDKLELPETVLVQALQLSQALLDIRDKVKSITIPAICLYSLIVACKKLHVNKVNTKNLMNVFKAYGYRINLSSLIKISTEVSVPMVPKSSEDYLPVTIPAIVTHPIVKDKLMKYYMSPTEYERKLYRSAVSILSRIDKCKRGGHNPYALAATSIYAGEMALSKMEKRRPLFSQHIVSESVEVAEYTIREQYGEFFREALLSFLSQISY
ncbi:MAG: hypothetical protein QXJ17_05360 [Nitrososphaeria archaeon]